MPSTRCSSASSASERDWSARPRRGAQVRAPTMASRRAASAGARWVALRFVRGESVARFGALDRNFPAGAARRPPGAKFFWGRRIVRPRRLQVIAGSLRIDAQRFGHTRREPVRMPETIVPQGFSWVGEISARALRAHRQEASSHVASAETPARRWRRRLPPSTIC